MISLLNLRLMAKCYWNNYQNILPYALNHYILYKIFYIFCSQIHGRARKRNLSRLNTFLEFLYYLYTGTLLLYNSLLVIFSKLFCSCVICFHKNIARCASTNFFLSIMLDKFSRLQREDFINFSIAPFLPKDPVYISFQNF